MERLFFVSLVAAGAGWLRAWDPEFCTIGNFSCRDGGQVSLCGRCNGLPDCRDGSDETCCHTGSLLCGSRGWRCGSGGPCIPWERVCDGHHDCSDGSDEAGGNCTSQTAGPPPACQEDEFRCGPSTECFPLSWVCDGHLDCPDQRDELGCESDFPDTSPVPAIDCAGSEDKLPIDVVVIAIVALPALILVVCVILWIRRDVLCPRTRFNCNQDSAQSLAKMLP